ncbi:hypothetical protein N0V95_000576 [Ascochyta clinopodiicola]|nr:hypothetical protein N0V95_000576 [Ascochyta clinopodiicola]
MSAANASTLYPKITQHISTVVKALKELHQNLGSPDRDVTVKPIPIVGSVKLHGTHADILVYSDDKIVLQSKNVRNITTTNDNQGFAAAMVDKTSAILDVRNKYLVHWRKLNPNTHLDLQYPVLIAGEWIGTNIQKDVAISGLSRRFVIVSVTINNSWIPDTHYPCIESSSASIFNITHGGTFHATIYPDDIARTLSEVEPQAEAVAISCSFAAYFDVHGEGEGIVWKPASQHLNPIPELWFKTKGGRFKPTFASTPKVLPTNQQEKRDAGDAVAAIWCTEERLQQGWRFLEEVGMLRDMKGLGRFLKWIQSDILTEEKGYIEDNMLDEGMLRISIAKIAKIWYMRHVEMGHS